VVVLLPLAALACTDEIPTATDPALFPDGLRPQTVEGQVEAAEFLGLLGRFDGYRTAQQAPFRLVAHDFDGLEAHTLARLSGFPRAVTYEVDGSSVTDSTFAYVGGTLRARVDTAAAHLDGPVTLQIWRLGETWDPATVTWEMAVDTAGERRPWSQPGGTRAELLAEVDWQPLDRDLDEEGADTVRWQLSGEAVAALAAEAHAAADDTLGAQQPRGLLVRAVGGSARLQLGALSLEALIDPESADTVLERTVSGGEQRFVHTPGFIAPENALVAGGVTAHRTLLRLAMPTSVNGLPLAGADLNRVELVLTPRDTGDGYRPLAPTRLVLRRAAEAELGREAPLGQVVGERVVQRDAFTEEGGEVRIDLTAWARRMLQEERASMELALLVEPLGGTFGVAVFDADPRLRVLFTTSTPPDLP
jgi:hypothetical protein